MEKFRTLLESTFKLRDIEGQDKVTDIRKAVRSHVKPGMKLHIASSYYYPNAIINEIVRQFIGKNPNFVLITKGINLNTINLIATGLVERVITTFHGNVYPVPRPNPAIQRAYKKDRVKIEEWSLYSFTQRLMAGALGLGFMPTNSIVGSSMAEENQASFKLIDSPFEDKGKTAVVKSIIPDISILHGWASDPAGNTIILPPYGTLPWGCMGSRGGVLVTAERLVSTDFIREHSHFVLLPAHFVKSVSLVPFGAHPHGMSNLGIEEFENYEQDYEFIEDFQKSTQECETHEEWIKQWILNCETQEDYLQKLGHQRLLFLKGKAHRDAWIHELRSLENEVSSEITYNPIEMMTVMASRKIKERVIHKGYDVILSGAGTANLAAWLGYYQLKEEGYHVSLAAEMGFLGYAPRPVDPFIFSFKNLPSCKMLTDVVNVLGIFIGGNNNKAIGSLGAGQIDKYGNINSTKLPHGLFLTGSGGSNDVASTAQEILVVIEQSSDRLVEKVPYITCPGHRVKTLITTLGIFEKLGDDQEFTLTQYFPHGGVSSAQEAIEKLRDKCGWHLKIAKNIDEVTPPTRKELEILRLFDPKRYFLGPRPDLAS